MNDAVPLLEKASERAIADAESVAISAADFATSRRNQAQRVETSPGEVLAKKPERSWVLERNVPMDRIKLAPNIRENDPFDEKDEADCGMVQSVLKNGIHQPCRANKKSDGTYEVTDGSRRYMAAVIAGLKAMSLLVTDNPLTGEEATVQQIEVNYHHKDMNRMDLADVIADLVETHETIRSVAEVLGIPEPRIGELLLLKVLLPEDQEKLRRGEMTYKKALAKARERKEGKGSHKKRRSRMPSAIDNGQGKKSARREGVLTEYPKLGYQHFSGVYVFWRGTSKEPPSLQEMRDVLSDYLKHLSNVLTRRPG